MMLSYLKHTKMIATLGPASQTEAVIRSFIEGGIDVFRLNFSHGTHQDHKDRHDIIRTLEKEMQRPLAIMADLQGPKLRVGIFASESIMLQVDDTVQLTLAEHADAPGVIPIPHAEIFAALKEGDTLLFNDGKISVCITQIQGSSARARVVVGGELSTRKGINVPMASLPISAITDKDKKDLAFALDLGVDWIALSFVQSAHDVEGARALIHNRAKIIAKIEKPKALEDITQIVECSDAIMVARGDLGVELPVEQVPVIQKRLISLCRKMHKPVIIATQMLESMIKAPIPTRAEVTDVANAVYEGVDAVMLSAESASGDFPLDAIHTMKKVIENAEQDPTYRNFILQHPSTPILAVERNAMVMAARQLAETIGAKVIVVYSSSGDSAISAAGERPHMPIMVLTPNLKAARQLSLIWGLYPFLSDNIVSLHQMVTHACDCVQQQDYAQAKDYIVILAGAPFGKPGSANILRLISVGETETYGN